MKQGKLKKIIYMSLFLFIISFSSLAHAAAQIQHSKHDFSMGNGGGPTNFANIWYYDNGGFPQYIEEICVFCHTPHNASTDAETSTYLWNRVNFARNYKMYSSSTFTGSPTSPKGVSLMCMSCHDGVTSIAANVSPYGKVLINAGSGPNGVVDGSQILLDTTGGISSPGSLASGPYNGGPPTYTWGANIGNQTNPSGQIDLSNDHPISIPYPSPAGSDFQPSPTDPSLRLFQGRVECATCHTVHDSTNAPFLAMSNTGSNMCLACHKK